MKYEYINDLTSDIGYTAYGSTLKELFENAAEALFSIISKIEKVKVKQKITVRVKAENYEDLLYNWLQELIALVDTEELFLCRFNIVSISDKSLTAECEGESISPELGNTLVKAVTNYKFKIETEEKIKRATVTLDI